MRIKNLIYENKPHTDTYIITTILHKNGLEWLDKAEIENAIIEIKDGKLYWHTGVWYYGDMIYCIWLGGIFKYGNWYNGVWYNGWFAGGIWHDGVFMNGKITGGKFIKGDFRNDTKIKKFENFD